MKASSKTKAYVTCSSITDEANAPLQRTRGQPADDSPEEKLLEKEECAGPAP